MKYSYPKLLLLLAFPVLFSSCGGEDLDDIRGESTETITVANISYSDLIGHWKLSGMEARESVDLDGDGTGNTNLMLETNCFDPMSIDFNSDMSFSAVNARLDFAAGENDNEFFCMQGNTSDTGTWDIQGDELTLHFEINGEPYTHKKILTLTNNNDTFSLEVTKLESNKYVEDPGDTVVSHVQVVELEYTRSQS